MLAVGDRAPAFAGIDQNGTSVDLAALLERGPVVLYFYPKDFTLVCTKQACLFRDAYDELSREGASVVGVSMDDGESHRRFAERHDLPFSLLPDTDKRIARAYDVLRLLGLLTKRVTFVIAPGGSIASVIHNELSARKHLDLVREALAKLERTP